MSMTRTASAIALAAAGLIVSVAPALGQDASTEACWTTEPGAVGSIDHPTDPEAIVLRMFTGGGFVPREIAFMESPAFTLYGNDVAIFRPAVESQDLFDPLPPYLCARLTTDQVDELLAAALDEAGLRDADELYANPNIVDVPSTTFTIDADGVAKSVTVQALGFDPQAPDPEARARFSALSDLLSDFESQVDASAEYDVPLYEAMLGEVWGEPAAEPIAWPWADVPPDAFVADDAWGSIVTLAPDQVAEVTEIPSGGQGFIVVELPDGTLGSLTIRPLLPDEVPA